MTSYEMVRSKWEFSIPPPLSSYSFSFFLAYPYFASLRARFVFWKKKKKNLFLIFWLRSHVTWWSNNRKLFHGFLFVYKKEFFPLFFPILRLPSSFFSCCFSFRSRSKKFEIRFQMNHANLCDRHLDSKFSWPLARGLVVSSLTLWHASKLWRILAIIFARK